VPAHLESLPFTRQEDEIIARAGDADALIVSSSPMTRRVMSALKQLKVVVRTGVGYDVIDVPAATDLGIVAVNIPDIWTREVANHALALLLAWNRRIVTLHNEVKAGVWQSQPPGPLGALHGETVGIVGFGNIGKAFARRVAALETHVIAYDPYVDDAQFSALGVERVSSLGELAARSDYVSVHTLLNAETRHLINEAFLRQMKPTACLINTSRGPVVDEQAIIRALQEQWIAGAALDVQEHEPPAPDNPLSHLDNVILTPHAAYYSTAAVAKVPQRCGEEVARVLTGQRPLHVVNPEVYALLQPPGAR
jgi:D-3-phosphoglycerate dehydrogenase